MGSEFNEIISQSSYLQRNSAIEILRILGMAFVVMSHCTVHSDLLRGQSTLFLNNIIMDWCVTGNLGVDIFILISGYFGCERTSVRKSIVPLLTQVWFYSAFCSIIYIVLGYKITLRDTITALFPTIFKEYWFFTAFFMLLIISPYINIFLKHISRQKFLSCILMLLLCWCIIPTFTTGDMYGSEVPQFTMFYLMGAYFKKFPDNIFSKRKVRNCVTIVCFSCMMLSSVMLFILFGKHTLFFYSRNSILTVGCAVGLLSMAAYKKPFHNNVINLVGKCTFGIYLFHDNPFIRKILWHEWLPKGDYENSELLIVIMIISVIIVMLAGTLIEYMRIKWISARLNGIVYFILKKIEMFFMKFKTKLPPMVN